jgi:hypothetical protein
MCLLTQQPSSVSFTDDFLTDVYNKNSDGLGVMYAEGGKLHIYKCLPATSQDFIDFYRTYADKRDCIWHARMRTHGDTDMENCHPYRVTDDIWLAHNGVLSMGNDADHTKSDTWHFIKNVLTPALTADPGLMNDPHWIRFMGSIIGSSNKFGLLHADGSSCIINKKSGVEFCDSWLSNTYAWTPSRFGFRTPQAQVQWQGGHYGGWDGSWEKGFQSRIATTSKPQSQDLFPDEADEDFDVRPSSDRQIKKYVKAAYNQWSRHGVAGIEQWVFDAPEKAAKVLSHWYEDLDEGDLSDLVRKDYVEAAEWIDDLFTSDSITPSWLA